MKRRSVVAAANRIVSVVHVVITAVSDMKWIPRASESIILVVVIVVVHAVLIAVSTAVGRRK